MSEEPELEIVPLGQIVLDVRAWVAEADGWNELYDDFAGEFFDALKHVLGEDLEERFEGVDEVVMFYAETACLEFFLAFRDEEMPSPIDAFLAERGEGLSAEQREFLEQLKESTFSLYEVTEAEPERYIVMKDLLREADPVRIDDDGTGMDFEVGETVGGRVITIGGKPTLTAIGFGLTDESRKDILEYYEESVKDLLKDEVKLLRKDPRTVRRARTAALQFLPPITTAHWVGDRFDEAEEDSPFEQVQLISVRYAEGPTEAQMHARLEDDPRFEKNPQRESEYVLVAEGSAVAMVRWEDGLLGVVGSRDGVDVLDAALRARFGPALGAPEVSEMSLEDALAQVEALDQDAPGMA